MTPKLVRDLSEAEKAVAKELEEQSKAMGSQELTVATSGQSKGYDSSIINNKNEKYLNKFLKHLDLCKNEDLISNY